MDAFERRWNILRYLLTGPKFRTEVVDHLLTLAPESQSPAGLSEASVSTDIKALRALGIGFRPLVSGDKLTKQAYELDLSRLDLFADAEDASALQAAIALFEELKLPEAGRLRAMFERIPEAVRTELPDPYTARLLRTGQSSYDPMVLATLQEGIRRGRMMRITYQGLNQPAKQYLVDRAALKWLDGSLYLHAHCPQADGPSKVQKNREFRIDRFQTTTETPTVEILKTPCTEPEVPSFDYKIWLSPSLASGFQHVPQRLRVLEETPDGSRLVAIGETIPLRAVRKVLSYGGQARVVSPDFLVSQVQETITRMSQPLE